MQCLQSCQSILDNYEYSASLLANSYYRYAVSHWPIHVYLARLDLGKELIETLKVFLKLGQNEWILYQRWIDCCRRIFLNPTLINDRSKLYINNLALDYSDLLVGARSHPVRLIVSLELLELAHWLPPSIELQKELGVINHYEAINLACRVGNIAMIALLLDKGADINGRASGKNHAGQPQVPLNTAIMHGNSDVIKYLITRGVNVNECERTQLSLPWSGGLEARRPLTLALVKNQRSTVRMLLEAGADVKNQPGDSPLHVATAIGDEQLCRVLMQKGADPRALYVRLDSEPSPETYVSVSYDGVLLGTPLHVAISFGSFRILKLYLDYGVNVDIMCNRLGTPLMMAIRRGRPEYIKFLLKSGANPNIHVETAFGMESPLFLAVDAKTCSEDSTNILLRNSAKLLGLQDEIGIKTILQAIKNSRHAFVQHALDIGINPIQQFEYDKERLTILLASGRYGDWKCRNLVVDAVKSRHPDFIQGLNDLLWEICRHANYGGTERAAWLTHHQTNPNMATSDGTRVLDIVVFRLVREGLSDCWGWLNVLTLLLHAGADVSEHGVGIYGGSFSASIAAFSDWCMSLPQPIKEEDDRLELMQKHLLKVLGLLLDKLLPKEALEMIDMIERRMKSLGCSGTHAIVSKAKEEWENRYRTKQPEDPGGA